MKLYDTGYGRDSSGILPHLGGRNKICPSCSHSAAPRSCLFYSTDGSLTEYAFSCGYIEQRGEIKLSMEHGVYSVIGFTKIVPENVKSPVQLVDDSYRIYQQFDDLREARSFFRLFPRKRQASSV